MNKKKNQKSPRRLARENAVQALYQWQVSAPTVADLMLEFEQTHDFSGVDKTYWHELVNQSINHVEELDEKMHPYLKRSFDSVNPVELSILRIAFYELCYRPEIPYRVIINEAVELAKVFAAIDSHRFVNGVLDPAAKNFRAVEFKD